MRPDNAPLIPENLKNFLAILKSLLQRRIVLQYQVVPCTKLYDARESRHHQTLQVFPETLDKDRTNKWFWKRVSAILIKENLKRQEFDIGKCEYYDWLSKINFTWFARLTLHFEHIKPNFVNSFLPSQMGPFLVDYIHTYQQFKIWNFCTRRIWRFCAVMIDWQRIDPST